jgi:hypothetical protein
MTKVFNDVPGGSLLDTPVNVPSWTVQSPLTGSNQSLTKSAGAGVNSGQSIGYTQLPAQAATGQASYVAPGALTGAAKLTDVQALAALVDTLNAALVTAGIEV